jgi:tetratricopeptide (TPR) repeat protein
MDTPWTLILSASALLLSLVSTVLTLRLQIRSTRNTIHDQLGELTQELINVIAENSIIWSQEPSKRDALFYSKTSNISYKLSALARQAVYLMNQDSMLVSDLQYSIVANALSIVGDFPLAESLWKKAIDESPNEYYKIINKRSFANFQFNQGRHEAGRKQYEEALQIWDNSTDFNKFTNGYSYQMWLVSEISSFSAANNESEIYYKRAKSLFESISNVAMRNHALSGLENARITVTRNTTLLPPIPIVAPHTSVEPDPDSTKLDHP